jgi:hypothetical protein
MELIVKKDKEKSTFVYLIVLDIIALLHHCLITSLPYYIHFFIMKYLFSLTTHGKNKDLSKGTSRKIKNRFLELHAQINESTHFLTFLTISSILIMD